MTDPHPATPDPVRHLNDAARLTRDKILDPASLSLYGGITAEAPLLVILAAGKGTRFGQEPKCIQLVHGTPLARHSVEAFRRFRYCPVICMVGYRYQDVSAALGDDNIYVRSDNPTGGTAYALFEAFSVPGLLDKNPLLVVTMGDRIVPTRVFRRLWETHCAGPQEADLTFLTAHYEPPKNRGKGRVLRDENGQVVRIIEEKDIATRQDGLARQALLNLTEGNCPLYAIRANTLMRHLQDLTNTNAQGQYYLTDIIEGISRSGGQIRTITTSPSDPEYDLLCSDVTRPMDLALLEGILSGDNELFPEERELDQAARQILAGRPIGQVASILRQLRELLDAQARERLGFEADRPVAIGISGGRLRIAFMHPDMVRFFGPAWQMPIGAGDAEGGEQIVVMVQGAVDRRIHLYPMAPKYRESINFIPSDSEAMYPGDEISDWNSYEGFGTRLSKNLLLSLGYFSDEELQNRRESNLPLPPPSLWASSNMRRPFALVANAIASLRTLRDGSLGAKVQGHLGRDSFKGLRLVCTGAIPQGGFSSSSAVTVATKNAINSLLQLDIPADLLVHLACQAEYGTGVRAGSLDQATEQKGRAGQGTLISSNPADNYRIIGTYPVPTQRFRVIFPYSVERDRVAWRWSWGAYGEAPAPGAPLTSSQTRKMTGKAAEIAALLTRLPLDMDFFKQIEADLVADGQLTAQSRAWICSVLRQLPLLVRQDELKRCAAANRDWYVEELVRTGQVEMAAARQKADSAIASMFAGWQDPVLRRTPAGGQVLSEEGVPLRAMVAYLFGEVAKNFHLIHHPDEWIDCVTRSQQGDRCVDLDPGRLPPREMMEAEMAWEAGIEGPVRLNCWLERHSATPHDYDCGLDDESLSPENPPVFRQLQGSCFFRGLALIDLAEAMLKRAFGHDAVAVRVNAAGQGDYFQVHIDTDKADPREVEQFIRLAFYRRFGIAPEQEFVQTHPGGGAAGVCLSRYDVLPQLIHRLQIAVGTAPAGEPGAATL